MYQCEGCSTLFEGTADEAFVAGWDTPERSLHGEDGAPGYGTICPNCDITMSKWWDDEDDGSFN